MKNLMLIIFLPLFFSFKTLPQKYRGLTKDEIKKLLEDKVSTRDSSVVKDGNTSSSALEIENNNLKKKLSKSNQIKNFSPTFGSQYGKIATFERFDAVIDGNIVSSGQPVTFKVDFMPHHKIPNGSYVSCTGTNQSAKYNYRIIAFCDRLITPDYEYEVSIGIKDSKKIDGIHPDFVYVGEEEAVLGEGFSAILSGIIDARKERVSTAFGQEEVASVKNSLLGGLIKATELANSKAVSNKNDSVTILAVNDRKNVILEFKKGFKYEKDN